MPRAAYSMASARVSPMTACFATVGEASRNDLESVGRGDIHDRSSASLDHSWQKRASAAPDAFEINGHAAIPILIAHCEGVAKHIDASVVDEDVGRPKRGAGRVTHRGDRSGIGDVRSREKYACAGGFKFRRHRRAGIGIDFGHDDPGPFRGEATRDRRPDALTGARNNRRLSIQPTCHAVPHDSRIGVLRAAHSCASADLLSVSITADRAKLRSVSIPPMNLQKDRMFTCLEHSVDGRSTATRGGARRLLTAKPATSYQFLKKPSGEPSMNQDAARPVASG